MIKFLDLLYHRYASPLTLLDTVIGSDQLYEFVDVMLEQIDEEKLWEMYLHQLFQDKSFMEWKDSVRMGEGNNGMPEAVPVTKREINAAIQNSQDILGSFVPE